MTHDESHHEGQRVIWDADEGPVYVGDMSNHTIIKEMLSLLSLEIQLQMGINITGTNSKLNRFWIRVFYEELSARRLAGEQMQNSTISFTPQPQYPLGADHAVEQGTEKDAGGSIDSCGCAAQ